MKIIFPSTSLRKEPNHSSVLETECIFGETVEVLDKQSGWLFCKLKTDNYCGWIRSESIGDIKQTSHRVIVNRTFIFSNKDTKSPIINYLPLGANLSIKKLHDKWAEVFLHKHHPNKTAFVLKEHIVDIDNKIKNWVGIAEKLIETPYKWGGRDTMGLDCSSLLQLSYQTYGENIPRNTQDQVKLSKKTLTGFDNLDRGCVVFWEGHVAIMVNRFDCIHANAFHMKIIIEPLKEVINRSDRKNPIIKIMNFN